MNAVLAVLVGLLAWVAWAVAGSVVAELAGPALRPLGVLLRPPLGVIAVVLTWLVVAAATWQAFHDPTGPWSTVALLGAVVGLILPLLVRDAHREARDLPAVTSRFPRRLSALQRLGLALVAAVAGGVGVLMFALTGPGQPETWVVAAGSVLFVIFFGGAAVRGRFSRAAVAFFGGALEEPGRAP